MRAPIFKRLTREDYIDAPAWIGRLFPVLNDFMQQTTAVLTNNVAFGENIQARAFTTTVTAPAGYATGAFEPIRFSWPGANLPNAVLITRVLKQDGTPYLGSVGTPAWNFVNGVVVTYVPGLVAGDTYSISFLVV